MQTKEKWDKIHSLNNESQKSFDETIFPVIFKQLTEHCSLKEKKFVEIGCGKAFLGEAMISKGWNFTGVDFSDVALDSIKKRFYEQGTKNFALINAGITNIPLASNSKTLIYGGGVLEHLTQPQLAIDESYRILKTGGVLFHAVPFFNIGNALYRMQWGGIPNIPVLKQISELIHITILGGKHMLFGYELQFTKRQLIDMYKRAGFKKIVTGRFELPVQMNSIKNKWLKDKLVNLSETNPQFWAMMKVVGVK